MTYWLISAACSLATFFAVLTLTAAFVDRAPWGRYAKASPVRRGNLLFVIATLPFTLAAVAAFGLVLPAFLRWEPRHSTERIDWPLALVALCGACTLLIAGTRLALATWRSHANALRWSRAARSIVVTDCAAHEVSEATGLLAVSGTLRPRFFVSSDVAATLNSRELAAAFAHEYGHVAARDNSKRLLLHALRLPGATFARLLAEWSAAAELAADEAAVRCGTPVLDLASALLAVARLRHGAVVSPGFSCLLPSDGRPMLGLRIARLLEMLHGGVSAPRRAPRWRIVAALALAGTLLVLIYPSALALAHAALESII